jgi:hypothetical protein
MISPILRVLAILFGIFLLVLFTTEQYMCSWNAPESLQNHQVSRTTGKIDDVETKALEPEFHNKSKVLSPDKNIFEIQIKSGFFHTAGSPNRSINFQEKRSSDATKPHAVEKSNQAISSKCIQTFPPLAFSHGATCRDPADFASSTTVEVENPIIPFDFNGSCSPVAAITTADGHVNTPRDEPKLGSPTVADIGRHFPKCLRYIVARHSGSGLGHRHSAVVATVNLAMEFR